MNTADESKHDDIEHLLPWHAAGTLSRGDAQRVEAALASDAELARRFALVREELGETVLLNEALGAPSPRAAAKLFAAIEAEPARRSGHGFAGRVGEFFAGLTPRTLAWSAALAALAILLQAGFIASLVLKQPGAGLYETASTPAPARGEGAYALVRFQPQASAAEVGKFLAANKLSVTAGPLADGIYRVKIADKPLAKDAMAARIKMLQEDPAVGFIAAAE